jgi:hypothetical protein
MDIWADADGTLMATFIQSTRFADIENSQCRSNSSASSRYADPLHGLAIFFWRAVYFF